MSQNDRTLGLVGNAAFKVPVFVATTANITLSGEQTIDGKSVTTDDRVLVKDQTDATQNGIWVADTGAWSRAKDFDGSYDIVKGSLVYVTDGSTLGDTWFHVTTDGPVIGTSSLTITATFLGDSSSLSFTAAGAGAVTRTGQSKMRDIVSVKDYGAVGIGAGSVVADTAAFLAAIATGLSVFAPGVALPASQYYALSSDIALNSNQVLYGDGGGTILQATVNAMIPVKATGKTNVHVRDLVINGGGQTSDVATGVSGVTALNFDGCTYFSAENIEIKKCGIKNTAAPTTDSTTGGMGLIVTSVTGASAYGNLRNCYVHDIAGGGNNRGDGIYIGGQNASLSVTTKAVTVRDCRVSTAGRHCYAVAEGVGTSVPTDIWFENCYGEKSALDGIDFEDGYDCHMIGSTFSACGNDQTYFDPVTSYGATYRLLAGIAVGNTDKNINISNCHLTGCYFGISWGGMDGLTLTNLKVESSTISDIQSLTLARSPKNLRLIGCEFTSTGDMGTPWFGNVTGEYQEIIGCKFSGALALNQMLEMFFIGCSFAGKISGGSSVSSRIGFTDCTFAGPFYAGKITKSSFKGCNFQKGLTHNITGADQNTFSECEFFEYAKVFDASNAAVVVTATDRITIASHGLLTAQRVMYSDGGGTAITGLTDLVAYFIIVVDANTIKLATTVANANAGTAIDLTAVGVGTTHYLSIEPVAHDAISFGILDEIFKTCRFIGSGLVTGVSGISLVFSSNVRLKAVDCEFKSFDVAGIKVNNGNAAAVLSRVSGNTFRTCASGILVQQGGIKDGVISENYFEGITGYCIDLVASSGSYTQLTIKGNVAGATVTNGLRVSLSGTGTWDYCINTENNWHNASGTKQSLSAGNANGYSDNNVIT